MKRATEDRYVCIPHYPYSPVGLKYKDEIDDCSIDISKKVHKDDYFVWYNEKQLNLGVGLSDVYQLYTRINATTYLYSFINLHKTSVKRKLSFENLKGLNKNFNYEIECKGTNTKGIKSYTIDDDAIIKPRTIQYCTTKEKPEDYVNVYDYY